MIEKILGILLGIVVINLSVYLFMHSDFGTVHDPIGTFMIRLLTVVLGLLGAFSIAFALFPKQIQRIMYGPPDRKFF